MKKSVVLAAAVLVAGCSSAPAASHSLVFSGGSSSGSNTPVTNSAQSGDAGACGAFWLWYDNQQTVSFSVVMSASATSQPLIFELSQLSEDEEADSLNPNSISLTNDVDEVQADCDVLGYNNSQG